MQAETRDAGQVADLLAELRRLVVVPEVLRREGQGAGRAIHDLVDRHRLVEEPSGMKGVQAEGAVAFREPRALGIEGDQPVNLVVELGKRAAERLRRGVGRFGQTAHVLAQSLEVERSVRPRIREGRSRQRQPRQNHAHSLKKATPVNVWSELGHPSHRSPNQRTLHDRASSAQCQDRPCAAGRKPPLSGEMPLYRAGAYAASARGRMQTSDRGSSVPAGSRGKGAACAGSSVSGTSGRTISPTP